MEDAFRFRYRVYCEEMDFLSSHDYPSGLETDEYDEDATHYIVYDDFGDVVGYMRGTPGGRFGDYPLLRHGVKFDDGFSFPPVGTTVEIGRYMVSSAIRHRSGGAVALLRHEGPLSSATLDLSSEVIQLRLIRQAYRNAKETGGEWFISAMEPTLARKAKRMGVPWEPAGPPADYYGVIVPHVLSMAAVDTLMPRLNPRCYEFLVSPEEDAHDRTVRPGEWSYTPPAPSPSTPQWRHA